jgi:hypothetical protein
LLALELVVGSTIPYVGSDVHKAAVSVAVAEGGRGGAVRHIGVIPNRPNQIAKLVGMIRELHTTH